MESRGYFGIGVLNIKTEVNYGTLFRSAQCFGANFIFLVGRRFRKMSSNTNQSQRHIPLYEYESIEDYIEHQPYDCPIIGIERTKRAVDIRQFSHPERASYILGPEDSSLPPKLLDRCSAIIEIPSEYCLNVAVAGSIVLYDRFIKRSNI